MPRDVIRVRGQAGSPGGRQGEDQVVAVGPGEPPAVGPMRRGEQGVRGSGEVQPPHGVGHEQATGRHRVQRTVAVVPVEGAADGDSGGRDGLTEHDEGEQLVALGDVVRMPWRHPGGLRPTGTETSATITTTMPGSRTEADMPGKATQPT
ncbi:hypothetical protein GCM10023080_074330 [Streptomyces pseudoechinosporeus]